MTQQRVLPGQQWLDKAYRRGKPARMFEVLSVGGGYATVRTVHFRVGSRGERQPPVYGRTSKIALDRFGKAYEFWG